MSTKNDNEVSPNVAALTARIDVLIEQGRKKDELLQALFDKYVSAPPATASAGNSAVKEYEDKRTALAGWTRPVSTFEIFTAHAEIPASNEDAVTSDGPRRRALIARVKFVRKPGRPIHCIGFEDAREDEAYTQYCLVEELRSQGSLSAYEKARSTTPDDGTAASIAKGVMATMKQRRWTNGMLAASRAIVSVGAPANRYVGVAAVRAYCITMGALENADGVPCDDQGTPLEAPSVAAE